MSILTRFFGRFYAWLLRLYPSGFRDEFGDEMQNVFADTLANVKTYSWAHQVILVTRELRDWPGLVLQEHLRARRKKMPSNGFFDEKPLPRSEMLAAMAIFLLPLISILLITDINPPRWIDYVLLVLFWGCIIFAIGLAISRRMPHWSLPYLGFVSMVGIILIGPDRIWSWIYPYFIESFGSRSVWPLSIRIIYVGIFDFTMMFIILLGALVLVNLLRLLPQTRGVWQRIRVDWTQLSFMLYGGLVFSIMLMFDEYRHEDIWKFMAWLCLALGAWFYIRTKGKIQRILALIGGATGAMWLVALAKWVLIPLQKWPTGYPVAPSEASRWVETSSAVLGWVFILIMLVVPALLDLLPQAPGSTISKEEGPVSA